MNSKRCIFNLSVAKTRIALLALMVQVVYVSAQYPNTITMNQSMIGDATIVAKLEVIHKPGFEVKAGLEYHAYIDYNFTGSGSPYDPPPAPGGISIVPTNMNYIITRSPQIDNFDLNSSATCDQVNVSIQYFDGLGKNIQDVIVMGSPGQKDVIKPYHYDEAGRMDCDFIPYASSTNTTGQFDPDFTPNQQSFIGNLYGSPNQNFGFSETQYGPSPLNRVVKSSAPGAEWSINSSHVTELEYGSNPTDVHSWKWENNSFSDWNWSPGDLFVTTTKNENANSNRSIIKEYKDITGKTVMIENINGTESLKTRYIYDDFGLLRCVVPPKAISPNDDDLSQLCYIYNYDSKKRLISKKLPGTDWVFMIYDKRDRLVMSQDGKMRDENPASTRWILTCYDELNRPVLNGIYHHTSPLGLEQMQNLFNGLDIYSESINGNYNDNDHGYTSQVVEGLGGGGDAYDILQVTYYDNYNFTEQYGPEVPYGFREVPDIVSEDDLFDAPRAQITGTKTRVITTEPTWDQWMLNVIYYDDKYRIIQTVSDHQFSNDKKEVISTKHSFTGRVEAINTMHTAFEKTTEITEKYRYDHSGRPLESTIEGLPGQSTVMTSSNHYNEAGQLTKRQTGSVKNGGGFLPFIQKIDYGYNIRQWLTNINDDAGSEQDEDIFSMRLFYDEVLDGASNTPQFNGNISAVRWNTNKIKDHHAYTYTYDAMNRLSDAQHLQETGGALASNDSWSEKNITYDPNGNILTLERYTLNGIKADQLSYGYLNNGNQISFVQDAQGDVANVLDYPGDNSANPDFSYDPNGNMTSNFDKGIIDILYTYLNKPEQIDFGNGEKIQYQYDGVGYKLSKKVLRDDEILSSSLIYLGNFAYDWNGTMQYMLTGEGRLVLDSKTFRVEYFMKDHLGNTRATYAQAAPGVPQVAEYQHYYPFGMQIEALGYSSGFDLPNNYRYNGKELQTDYGLEWYDYGARFYDPQLGSWHVIDPAAELSRKWSPYSYAMNNPIKYIDPDGRDVLLVIWGTDNGNIGHAGIAVSNYKEVSERVKVDGKWTTQTRMVPDGTYTYRDLWPGPGEKMGKSNFDENVKAGYNEKIVTLDDLKNTDVTGSEGYAPDGVIQLTTDKATDDIVNTALESAKSNGVNYNGVDNNCSDFAKEGVLYAAPSGESVGQTTEKIGNKNVTTPNQLYKATKGLSNATVVKDAGNKVNNSFINGVSAGSEKRRNYVEKKVND